MIPILPVDYINHDLWCHSFGRLNVQCIWRQSVCFVWMFFKVSESTIIAGPLLALRHVYRTCINGNKACISVQNFVGCTN
jgi:hypothetical protein